MLICKVYVSSSKTEQNGASLLGLLDQARRNNASNNITGMLCVFDSNFLQVLEGEEASVNATFEKIRKDPRHRNIIELLSEPIDQRLFADWAMALTNEGKLNREQIESCRDLRDSALDPASTASHRGVIAALLEAFKLSLR